MLWKWFILQNLIVVIISSIWKVKPTDLRLVLSEIERDNYVVRIIIKIISMKAVFELLVTYRHNKGQPS